MTAIYRNRLIRMLTLQNEINCVIDPDWVKKRQPFLRAVIVESCELLEHNGWKWWKKQTPDIKQCQMELVDIWHFVLSYFLINNNGNIEKTSNDIIRSHYRDFEELKLYYSKLDTLSKIEHMIRLCTERRFCTVIFALIMKDYNLTDDNLFKLYIGKNALNTFRQNHGYKEGTYKKIWDCREDNEHLRDILDKLDADNCNLYDKIMKELTDRYVSLI